MPTNVIIYPNGLSGGNTNPHAVFEDAGGARIQLNVGTDGIIVVSSTTNSTNWSSSSINSV